MKKITIILLLISIMMFQIPTAKSEIEYKFYYTNTEGVNVRNAPNLNSTVIGKLSLKTYVLKMGMERDSSGNIWYKIYDFYSNLTGYSASWLLNDSGITISGEDIKFTAKNKAEYLNVRVGPGREFKIASTLQQNEKINVERVITRSDDETWYKFKRNDGKYYFVAGWYMEKMEEVTENPPPTPTSVTATSKDYVNLREGPSINYSKIALVEKGNKIPILGIAKNSSGEVWLQVDLNGKIGWVYSIYFDYKDTIELETSYIGQEGETQDAVNLRVGPALSYSSVKVIEKNQKLKVLGVAINKEKETWFETSSNNVSGWVRSDLLSIEKKKKGVFKSYNWTITPEGIDVNVLGEDLPKPNVITIEDPLRIILSFSNTTTFSESLPLELNIYPITRIRNEKDEENLKIVVDIIRELPYSVEYKSSNIISIHFILPKINEKYVEVSGREIYARVVSENNNTYLDIESVASAFDISLDSEFNFVFYGISLKFDKTKMKESEGTYFIPLRYLESIFNVSIVETSKEIFIDPMLIDYKIDNIDKTLVFSFPPRTKKIEEGGKTYFVFYAESGKVNIENSTSRNGTNPPVIKLLVSKNASLEVIGNSFRIYEKEIKTGRLSNKTIVIDPGHGSYNGKYLDVGAIGPTQVKEVYVAMSIALKLKEKLEQEGAKVILTHDTPDNPSNPTLSERATIANSSGADLFISIHLNSSINKSASGTETYYWFESSKKLAQSIQKSLIKNLNTIDRGVKKDNLYLVRNITTMPAILSEVLFISNPDEEKLCNDQAFIEKIANAFKEGIEDYLYGI